MILDLDIIINQHQCGQKALVLTLSGRNDGFILRSDYWLVYAMKFYKRTGDGFIVYVGTARKTKNMIFIRINKARAAAKIRRYLKTNNFESRINLMR